MIFLKKLAKKFPRQNSIFNNDQLSSWSQLNTSYFEVIFLSAEAKNVGNRYVDEDF